MEPSTSSGPSEAAPSTSATIGLDDVGFAKHSGFEWHPALKTASFARGTRLRVTFFGTGEKGTVNESNWVSYSEEEEARILSLFEIRKAAFKDGLKQLKNLRERILK